MQKCSTFDKESQKDLWGMEFRVFSDVYFSCFGRIPTDFHFGKGHFVPIPPHLPPQNTLPLPFCPGE